MSVLYDKLLLEHKKHDIEILNNALICGIKHWDIVQLLLNHGANNYMRARTKAINSGHGEVENLIRQHKIDKKQPKRRRLK